MTTSTPPTVPWRPVGLFLAVAYGVSWVPWSPLMFGWIASEGGLFGTDAGPVSLAAAAVTMLAPSLAVLVVFARFGRPRDAVRATGLGFRPLGRVVRYSLLGMGLFTAISLGSLAIGAALGLYHFDLTHFSGLRESLGLGPDDAPLWPAAIAAVVMFVPGLPLMFGEEWGWRGYLEPRLESLGMARMVLLSGLVWGLWHLPAAFVDDRDPVLWLFAYVVDCTLSGALLCWLRLRTGSVWPAVFTHAAMSSFPVAVAVFWLGDAAREHDVLAVEALSGWIGWILKAVVLLGIVLAGGFGPLSSSSVRKGPSSPALSPARPRLRLRARRR